MTHSAGDPDPTDRGIGKWFDRVGLRLVNSRWSWGASDGELVVLRGWVDQFDLKAGTLAVLRHRGLEDSQSKLGRGERIAQLRAIAAGKKAGFAILAQQGKRKGKSRSIATFDGNAIYPIIGFANDSDGSLLAKLAAPLTMEAFEAMRRSPAMQARAAKLPIKNPLTMPPEPQANAVVNAETAMDKRDDMERRFGHAEIRPHQAAFRLKVFRACEGRCVISLSTVPEVLEAAHLRGRDWRKGHNEASDGILLRRDLHALYDRDLLDIDASGLVTVKPLALGEYRALSGRMAKAPHIHGLGKKR